MTTVSWFPLVFDWVDKAPPLTENLKMITVSGFERVMLPQALPEKLTMTTVPRIEGVRS